MLKDYRKRQDRAEPTVAPSPDPAVDYASNAVRAEEATSQSHGSSTPLLDAAGAGSKADALRNHERSVRRIDALMSSALDQEIPPGEDDASRLVLLRNSAEWIDSGQVGLQILDETHDTDRRAPPGKVAYFDTRAAWDGPADYDETDLTNNAGVTLTFPENGHFEPATNTVVFAAAQSQRETDLANTLIHEMQHACDSGPNGHDFERGLGPRPIGRYDAPMWVYQGYASEYRARVIDPVEAGQRFGDPALPARSPMKLETCRDDADPDVISRKLDLIVSRATGFANDQQEHVWADMIRDPSTTNVWYDYETGEWTRMYAEYAHYYVLDSSFRAYVDGLGANGPVGGGNAVNSIRVQALAEAMSAGKPGLTILAAAENLDGIDLAFLQDPARSLPFWTAAQRYLATRLHILARVQSLILGRVTVDPTDEHYVVVAGDTLIAIAERVLGDRALVAEILRLNPQITDRDRIDAGDVLRLPPVP